MRPIDADAIIWKVDKNFVRYVTVFDILKTPTIEISPVTCKRCRYRCGEFCEKLGIRCPSDEGFYCSYGDA